ncbi:MAG: hypothetical protein ACJ72N_03685 [Labedaea sp.]
MYLDPSEGEAGKVLDILYGAATSGALKVDPQTGETTLKFLDQVQELVERMRGDLRRVDARTPLGGGFAERIGGFNHELASGGDNSVHDQLTRFHHELGLLKQAVVQSMRSYLGTETASAAVMSQMMSPARGASR